MYQQYNLMVLLRRTLNQGLPAEIAENIVDFLPRLGKETSGTIQSKFKKTPPNKKHGVRKIMLKRDQHKT